MKFDSIIIGGGHNGLVTAAYLAKAGQKVLVLERRATLGGAAATEEVFPDCQVNTGADDAGLFSGKVVADLDLANHGLEFIESPVAACSLQPDGPALTLWRDPEKSVREIAGISKKDAVVFPEFVSLIHRMSEVLQSTFLLEPPEIDGTKLNGSLPWLKTAINLKRLGKRDMMEFLRVLPMSVREFMDDWFESETLKGVLGSAGVSGTMLGPMGAGTAYVMLHHYCGAANGGYRSCRFVKGGIGQLSRAIAAAAEKNGAEIRTECEVARIIINEGKVAGARLADGNEIECDSVVSNADPRRTYFGLVGAPKLGTEFNRKVKNIRFRGSTAKLNLLLNGLPQFKGVESEAQLSGHIVICPDLEYLERAYDDAKYGRISEQPYLDITIPTIVDPSLAPPGTHLMSVVMRYATYSLNKESRESERDLLMQRIIDTITKYAAGFPSLIQSKQIITPGDFEKEYALTEGNIYHAQMAPDQLLFMRPVPGWGRYRTPVENLYLCGAATHPGGGVTGAPGYNAARAILREIT